MAHNFGQVKTPTVYLDFMNYYVHCGFTTYDLYGDDYEDPTDNRKWTYLDPYSLQRNNMVGTSTNNTYLCRYSFHNSKTDGQGNYPAYAVLGSNINYLAILSHELGGEHAQYGVTVTAANNPEGEALLIFLDAETGENNRSVEHLNAEEPGTPGQFRIPSHGSTIVKFDGHQTMAEDGGMLSIAVRIYDDNGSQLATNSDEHLAKGIGAISVGNSFKFPQAPDMSLTMTREYDFVQTQETMSGKSISTVSNLGATFGHGEQPFGLYDYEEFIKVENDGSLTWNKYSEQFNKFRRVGRRVWDVSFSQIGADDLFHAYESGNFSNEDIVQSGIEDSEVGNIQQWDGAAILHDNPIYKMITYTHAGRLPFIWQPDSDDNTPLGFCLAKLDMKSFSMEQDSFERYSISFTVREVW